MHAAHWINYEERFDVVLAHIHDNLADPLDLVTLARVAGLSPKHWHRVYASAYGETLPATVKRLRMQRASALLANTDLPVTEIAARVGYPNVPSFTRAFGERFGMPPGLYRTAGRHSEFRIALSSDSPDAFAVDIRSVGPVDCVAVEHTGSYLQIDRAFGDLAVWFSAHNYASQAQQYLGVFLSDPTVTDESALRSLACFARPDDLSVPLAPIARDAANVVEYTITGGTYAVLTHIGPYADMPAKYDWLFGCWVIHSGWALADRPVVERYVTLPQGADPLQTVTEMWVPLAEGQPAGEDGSAAR